VLLCAWQRVMLCVAACCGVLQCVLHCLLQCVAVCCNLPDVHICSELRALNK